MSETVKEQYNTSDKLSIRITLHSKYSTNKQGFGNWIFSNYRIREGMSVLELGCGTGEMWCGKNDIIERCSKLILSDFSEGMLETAQGNLRDCPGIEYRCIDIQDIPYPDKTFDVVIANMMLYHVPDLMKGLREVQRVLKESGTFYCATYGENGMMEQVELMFDDLPISGARNYSFTLQNGAEKLENFFSKVQTLRYEDALEVTDVEDMVDYIYSLPSWSDIQDLSRDVIRSTLERNMHDGVLRLPKDYGMFIAEGPGEKIFLVEPAEEYAEDVWAFRSEILENDADDENQFAGCLSMDKCTSPEEWIDICRRRKSEDTCQETGVAVPSTTYLAVRGYDNKVVGVIDLRHHINHPILGTWGGHCGYSVRPSERGHGYAREMLRLNIINARRLGIDRMLVTCDETNPASESVILANGGVYEKSIDVDGSRMKRFWIDTNSGK
ncbi:MAG: GNAT family N-acetyltransferase [Lachnospiraceae bacterium]|nr:GNAT family N-acetyltransferase [Lachnospiraceae bacterium]